MFNATKPFKDTVTNYPKEPSLRIGRRVPNNAVNLAYYYNPTATDAEKVLTAEAPRNTIDHRVEEAYRYLFDQASDDDDLFPGSVYFEDEEGYQGRLGRMYVNWYPEAHIEVKNVQQTKDIIVVEKSEVPKMFEYSDEDDYHGNLYLDAVDYEVTKTKDLNEYKYIIVNSTETLNSSVGAIVYGGGYFLTGKSVNPGDVISGYLIKKGFVILKEKENDLINKTLIVNYGESGRRDVFWGYTIEVTIQFLTANTNEVVCVTTAEGIGDTEADDITKAITRALDAVFLQ